MPRISDIDVARQLDELAALLAAQQTGISRASLADAYERTHGRPINWRTLLRRLERLVAEGRAVAEGEERSPNRSYRAANPASVNTTSVATPEESRTTSAPALAAATPVPTVATGQEEYIPLSPDGAKIRALITAPRLTRKRVGYDHEFLERYEPGMTWYLPGELRGRLYELGRTPEEEGQEPAGTYARAIYEPLLIDLSWSSSRLEGNRYSKLDTKELLEHGREAGGKSDTDTQMILNHKAAIDMLVDRAEEVGFNRRTFLGLHAMLSENLLGNAQDEGRLRTRPVDIEGSNFTPLSIPQKIEEHFGLILRKAGEIPDPFEQAFFIMVHVPYLQPFIDVNKRTSRLGANVSLIKANLCPLSFVDVPRDAYTDATLAVYELQRIELLRDVFTWAYERSCEQYAVVRESVGKPDPIRLHHREQLRDVVRTFVQGLTPPEPERLELWAVDHEVPAHDVPAFVDAARAELLDLHEGLLKRYRLRPSELAAWNAQFGSPQGARLRGAPAQHS